MPVLQIKFDSKQSIKLYSRQSCVHSCSKMPNLTPFLCILYEVFTIPKIDKKSFMRGLAQAKQLALQMKMTLCTIPSSPCKYKSNYHLSPQHNSLLLAYFVSF